MLPVGVADENANWETGASVWPIHLWLAWIVAQVGALASQPPPQCPMLLAAPHPSGMEHQLQR